MRYCVEALQSTLRSIAEHSLIPRNPSETVWYRSTHEGVVGNDGASVFSRTPESPGPLLRTPDGDVFLLHGDKVFVLRDGAVEFQSVDLPSPAFGLARSRQGEVIWWDQLGSSRRAWNRTIEAGSPP